MPLRDFNLKISQINERCFEYKVSVSYGGNAGHMHDQGKYENPELCFKNAMAFAKVRPIFHKTYTPLTERNMQIFQLYAVEGMTYDEIAQEVGIVRPRVAYHVYRVRDALGAKNVHHAVFVATSLGIIP